MEKSMRLAIALVPLLAVFAGGGARGNDQFNSVAAGCVPGDPAMHFNRYLITAGTVKHQSNKVGLITLYCNIPMAITPPKALELTYSDDDPGTNTFVSAAYIKMHKSSGGITTVATASSNNGIQDGTVHSVETSFSDTYDLIHYLYYVRVDIDRSRLSNIAVFYGVTVN
jgi:hypothetical protein